MKKEEISASSGSSKTRRVAARKPTKQNRREIPAMSKTKIRRGTPSLLKCERHVIQQEEFSKLVVESLAFPYLVIDANDYTIQRANTAAGLGDLPKGTPCYKVFHNRERPCQPSEIACPVQEVRKRGSPCVMEHLHYDERGELIEYGEIHAHPVFDAHGKVAQVITCTIDRTEQKKAEQKLRASAVQSCGLFQTLPIGIILVTFEGEILQCNAALSRLTGYPLSQLVTMNALELLQSTREYEQVWEQLKTREDYVHDGEAALIRKNGSVLHARFTISRIALDGSTAVLVSVIDISQRKQAEAEIEESVRALEQKNAALSILAEQIEIEKHLLKDEISANVRELVFPLMEKLRLNQGSSKYLDLLEHRIRLIADGYGITIDQVRGVLSPRETEICARIQSGLTSKEISQLLGVSYQTVEKHRRNIRKKVGLSGKKMNLVSYLQNQSIPKHNH